MCRVCKLTRRVNNPAWKSFKAGSYTLRDNHVPCSCCTNSTDDRIDSHKIPAIWANVRAAIHPVSPTCRIVCPIRFVQCLQDNSAGILEESCECFVGAKRGGRVERRIRIVTNVGKSPVGASLPPQCPPQKH